jgi:hypothetical protein
LADVAAAAAAAHVVLCRFVELDRCAAAAEAGYAVGLFKVLGADSMAKNDLLVGLPYAPAAAPAAAAVAGSSGSTSLSCGDAVRAGFRACSKQLVDRGLLFTAAMLGARS